MLMSVRVIHVTSPEPAPISPEAISADVRRDILVQVGEMIVVVSR